jgi:hypothetical protein
MNKLVRDLSKRVSLVVAGIVMLSVQTLVLQTLVSIQHAAAASPLVLPTCYSSGAADPTTPNCLVLADSNADSTNVTTAYSTVTSTLYQNNAMWIPLTKNIALGGVSSTVALGYNMLKTSNNWPTRPPDCTAPQPNTGYKEMTQLLGANTYNLVGDCSSYYEDGGTSSDNDVPLGYDTINNIGYGGAWLSPGAIGGWALPASATDWTTNDTVQPTNKSYAQVNSSGAKFGTVCSSAPSNTAATGINPTTVIWGFPDSPGTPNGDEYNYGPDLSDSTYGQPYTAPAVESEGTTIFRAKFDLTQPELDALTTGTTVDLHIVADDFYKVFIDGIPIYEEDYGVSPSRLGGNGSNLTSVIKSLRAGTHIIAIQAIDKTVNFYRGYIPGYDATGLCYSLSLEQGASLTCGTLAPIPGLPNNYTASVNYVNSAGGTPPVNYVYGNYYVVHTADNKITSPAGGGNPYTNVPNPDNTPSNTFTEQVTIVPNDGSGQYVAHWSAYLINDPSVQTGDCTQGQSVGTMPYLKVYGKDVFAGGSFDTSAAPGVCTANLDAGTGFIKTYGTVATAPATGMLGSSTEFGAFALDVITGFGSASQRTTAPISATGLSFSNTNNISGLNADGGDLGTNHCITNYRSSLPAGYGTSTADTYAIPSSSYGAVSIAPAHGTLELTGGTNFDGHQAIYVSGNVWINTNITYAGANGGVDAWSALDPTTIPSLYVIATGNIYIDPSVTQLDGVYVAQPVAAGRGLIYTCQNEAATLTAATADANCASQLTVNGSFVAQNVKFWRSIGDVATDPTTTETPTSAHRSCTLPGNVASAPIYAVCAAEVFNFSPELYLTEPAIAPNGGPALGKYDYITSLSPVL